jgi:hypothetical protein|tara:strand:- start:27836 stop:28198 length:363 start_codon:yes stop_codon:yes gene_type:complete
MILVSLPKRKYASISESEIKEVRFGKYTFKVSQFVHAYHVEEQNRTGFMLTSTSVRDLAKKVGKWSATLYVKVRNSKGLWEIKMPNTQLKQLEDDVIWFVHHGVSTITILKKPSISDSWS